MSQPSIQQQIAALADERLLDWVQHGKEIYDEDGGQIFGPDGKPMRRDLTAAEMSCVIKRLGQCGVAAAPVPGSPIGQIVESLRERGVRLAIPDLPGGPDPASED